VERIVEALLSHHPLAQNRRALSKGPPTLFCNLPSPNLLRKDIEQSIAEGWDIIGLY